MPDGTNSTILLPFITRPLPASRVLPVNIAAGDLSHRVWFCMFKFSYYCIGVVDAFELSSSISWLTIIARKSATVTEAEIIFLAKSGYNKILFDGRLDQP